MQFLMLASRTYERRRKFTIKIHANLVFQACISFLRCFRQGNLRICWQLLISFLRCFRQEWRISVCALFAQKCRCSYDSSTAPDPLTPSILVDCCPLVYLTYHLAIVLPFHQPNDHQTIPKRTWEDGSLKVMGVRRFGAVPGRVFLMLTACPPAVRICYGCHSS